MKIAVTNAYKRDFKKRVSELIADPDYIEVMHCLLNRQPLPVKYKDHGLIGNWQGFRDCHIKPDLVLIYAIKQDELHLVRLGSHAELFD